MTTESFLIGAVNQIWTMARHTVCQFCQRYTQTNKEQICRKCMTKAVRDYYEYADAADAETNTHTESGDTE